jgi:predicted ATPase
LTEAGLAARAIPYWWRAGELAAGRSANLEAIAHLSKGLELIGTLPDAPERRGEELVLRLAIGGPLIATKGHPAPEVERNYSRALALCDQLGRSAELFTPLRGLWHCYFVRGELRRAHDLVERLVVLADEGRFPLRRALARRALGSTLFTLSRFADATAALDEGVAIDDAAWQDRRADLLLYTERPGVVCRQYSSWNSWFLGFPDRALATMEAALALCQRLSHPFSIASVLCMMGILHNLRREFDAAVGRAEAAIELANEHHLLQYLEFAMMCRGVALVGLGRHAEAIAQLRAGLVDWHNLGAHAHDTVFLGFLAEAHLRVGQFDEALTSLDRAAEAVAATGERYYQAELHRLRGAVLAATGNMVEAESWFRQALDTACSQQAKSLELRAATSLARLWLDQGKRAQAQDLLAPAYGWFTEGFDTADLKDAKALLDELR